MTERIRVAVAGLGAVAQSVHIPLLVRRWDLFEIVAVCDLSAALREAVGERCGVPASQQYADAHDMVAKSGADGLLLLTSGSHAHFAGQALRHGMPVFCEKPLAYTVSEADELADVAAGRNALLLGYMKEHDDAIGRMRELLTRVDGVRAVDVRVLHPSGRSQLAFANLRPPPDDLSPATRGRLRSDAERQLDVALGTSAPQWLRRLYEQVVVSSVIHNTSLLRSLFGGITAFDDVRVWPDDAFPPSVQVTGGLANDARIVLSWHYLEDYPAYRETLTVHHARGSMEVTFATPYLLNAPTTLEVVESAGTGEARTTYLSTTSSFENELVEFHQMVTQGAAPIAGIAEGRADIITSQRIVRRLAEQQGVPIGGEAATW